MPERLVVARLGHLGDGVCATPAGEVYVPYALPGETVEVEEWRGHPDRRQLIEVERASHERVAPICPHFGLCGGCALQHWARTPYREWKRALVIDALARVGLDAPLDALIDAHGEGRRRAVFHARRGSRDVLEVGFAARKSHQIVAIDRCPILAPQLDRAVATAWAIAEQVSDVRKPLDIQVTASEGGLDVDVRGSEPLSAPQIARLADVAEQHRLARLTRHGEIIAQRVAPTVRIGRARVKLPPGAFLQATAAGETALARLVETHCAAAATVADLFCGVGPFALRLAERARVRAIDSDATAIAALQQAANATSGLKRVQAETRDLFRRPLRPDELTSFDAVVFDPPRQGGEAQVRALAASAVPTIVAVSCNPATFARDARVLAEGGYRLARVTPIDQFLYSTHVEVVALLQRAHGV
jgi:23S rRNA (uracil1939-C5)-methyltransferase